MVAISQGLEPSWRRGWARFSTAAAGWCELGSRRRGRLPSLLVLSVPVRRRVAWFYMSVAPGDPIAVWLVPTRCCGVWRRRTGSCRKGAVQALTAGVVSEIVEPGHSPDGEGNWVGCGGGGRQLLRTGIDLRWEEATLCTVPRVGGFAPGMVRRRLLSGAADLASSGGGLVARLGRRSPRGA